MEKLKLKVAELKTAEVLEREELKQVLSGVKSGSGSGSGSGKGSGSGSGSKGSGSGSGSKPGSGSGSGSKPGSGSGSGSKDPNPKITACIGKQEGDSCSYINDKDQLTYGRCEYGWLYQLFCHERGI